MSLVQLYFGIEPAAFQGKADIPYTIVHAVQAFQFFLFCAPQNLVYVKLNKLYLFTSFVCACFH